MYQYSNSSSCSSLILVSSSLFSSTYISMSNTFDNMPTMAAATDTNMTKPMTI
ncbi:V063; CPXV-BR_064 V063 [Cowpox virus]|uniref:CPXV063 protein n=2 Tax=Cowpox virus TaxID=10243 RepID=A0A1X9T9W8_COWPX|nr:CPXV063 protein [Cowpox virus]AAM13508.1 CPXV063 protein [Cowpox virus]ARR29942.1 CPXV063 protein [Cowpox virus]ARR30563.1 CPXV063 protein [Cowpox virus]ATB55103.1 CPXV063 protein [Cowpox virus]ATB55325.1 CPXV063 protein [Cowpox virus]